MLKEKVYEMNETAVILAGGKGTRLKPYTLVFPKPLVPLGNTPILEIILRQLKRERFRKINIAVNHQAELIETYCGDGSKYGLDIKYFLEKKPLGTIGPLANMRSDLPENFIVMNGDVLSDISYKDFLQYHIDTNAAFTIACYERTQKVDYGVLEIEDGILTAFQEKPQINYEVSMGIYAVNRSILRMIPEDCNFGFDDLMYKLLGEKVKVNIYKYNGYWMDIGRPEDYEQATADLEIGRIKVEVE